MGFVSAVDDKYVYSQTLIISTPWEAKIGT